jgi:hypothetical protein
LDDWLSIAPRRQVIPAMTHLTALVRPASVLKQAAARNASSRPGKAALLPPADSPGGISWGAAVRTLAAGSLELVVCYPFRPGTVLAVRLEGRHASRTVLARVREATDQGDGAWLISGELTGTLTDHELGALR